MEAPEPKPNESTADQSKPDGLLYHYTDQHGLLGILRSKSIWATHVRYLNDATEFVHGIKIAMQCVKETKIDAESFFKHRPDSWPRDAPRRVGEILDHYVDDALARLNNLPVYVTCFFDSEPGDQPSKSQGAGDKLSQWRAYSKGSAGFSIGFDKGSLQNYIESPGPSREGFVLLAGNCSYDEEEHRRILEKEAANVNSAIIEILKRILYECGKGREPNPSRDSMSQAQIAEDKRGSPLPRKEKDQVRRNTIARELDALTHSIQGIAAGMVIPAAFMKHWAFRDEREWRIAELCASHPAGLSLRPGKSSLIPYVPIPLPGLNPDGPSLIRQIIVGPSPEIENAVAAAKLLLTSQGFRVRSSTDEDGIEVLPSRSPYRDW
jgi:hypothetical protein